ncbi:MAG: ATP-binding cassette domain-containing protein [Chloroflexi bacterium]|nr:ATP-binding cassette domain-containing protein [Chloroflexota bacterium]
MLSVESLSKTFFPKTVDEVLALRGLDLHLQTGDVVSVIGSNGAGKSTLLNAIAGVFPCERGRIVVDGSEVTRQPEHRRARLIARVTQDPKQGTAPAMSIEEHLAMANLRGGRRGLGRGVTDRQREQFRTALAELEIGLENRMKAPVGTLSGGQRQALALVMAGINRPALLLLDEHTANLDPKTGKRILDLTQRVISEHKLTTLMVTHNMDHAIRYGNRLIMMHQGQIVLDIRGDDKLTLSVHDLIARFESQAGARFLDDRVLLN